MEVTENGADALWNAGKSMLMLSAADGADPVVVTNNDEEMMLSTDTDGGDPPTHRHCCHCPRDCFYI